MKTRQRRSFSAEMKSRIALEAIKGQKTIQEIASHYRVHPNQVTNWKRQAVEGMSAVFADRRSRPDTSEETVKAELYQQIGEMKMEVLCRARHSNSYAGSRIMPSKLRESLALRAVDASRDSE